jgi:site-specific recombinase XerD
MGEDLIETFLRQNYSGASRRTVGTRRIALQQLQAHLQPRRLEQARTEDLKEWLAANPEWSTNTRMSKAAAARVFYRWLQDTDRRADNPALRMGRTPARKGVPKPTPTRRYREARVRADELGVRAILALELPAKLGLRREEACAVHTDHVEEGWLRVVGKGDKERMVPIPPDVQALLDTLPSSGWVFPSRKGGHIRPNRLGEIVSQLLGDGWTTHSLRHRFGTNAMAASHDLRVTAELMGHASTNTTAGYTAVASRDKRAAVEAAEQLLDGTGG